jgi:hypothetical protein
MLDISNYKYLQEFHYSAQASSYYNTFKVFPVCWGFMHYLLGSLLTMRVQVKPNPAPRPTPASKRIPDSEEIQVGSMASADLMESAPSWEFQRRSLPAEDWPAEFQPHQHPHFADDELSHTLHISTVLV